MATLIRPKGWGLQKPQRPAGVDASHPLAAGLAGAWLLDGLGGRPVDLITRYIGSMSGVGNSSGQNGYTSLVGGSMKSNGVSGTPAYAMLRPSGSPVLSGKAAWTIWGTFAITGTCGSNGYPLYCERASSGNDILKLAVAGPTDNGRLGTTYRNDGGTLINTAHVAGLTANSVPHAASMVFTGASLIAYMDGKSIGSTAWAGNNTLTNASLETRIGSDPADSAQSFGAVAVGAVYVWTRALSPAEILQLQVEPYAFIQPEAPRQRYWGPVTTTVSASFDTAALTLTAQAPTATATASGTFGTATLTLTANAPTGTPGTASGALDSAALALTAQAPTASPGSAAGTLDVAALILAAQQPTLTPGAVAALLDTAALLLTANDTTAASGTVAGTLDVAALLLTADELVGTTPNVRGYSNGAPTRAHGHRGVPVRVGSSSGQPIRVGSSSGGPE